VNVFIWIVIKNYWCDIKNEKSENALMLIVIENLKKWKKRRKKERRKSTSKHLTNKPSIQSGIERFWENAVSPCKGEGTTWETRGVI